MTTLSPSRQRNAVSEGFALGLLMCGRYELPYKKIPLEFAFGHAFRDWSHRNKFPRVVSDMRLGYGIDPLWVMTHADEAKHTSLLYWEQEGSKFSVQTRGDWSEYAPSAEDAAASVGSDVPAEGWKELAKAFLDDLGEDVLKA